MTPWCGVSQIVRDVFSFIRRQTIIGNVYTCWRVALNTFTPNGKENKRINETYANTKKIKKTQMIWKFRTVSFAREKQTSQSKRISPELTNSV